MSNPAHDLKKEASAAAHLLATLRTTLGDDAELKQTVVEGETSLYEAAQNVVERLMLIKILRAGIAASLATLKEDLEARAARLKAQDEMLRNSLLSALEACEVDRLELPVATVYTSKGKDSLGTFDEAKLPSKYFKRPDPVVDKTLLLDDLKAGTKVEGAALKNGAPVINVRYK